MLRRILYSVVFTAFSLFACATPPQLKSESHAQFFLKQFAGYERVSYSFRKADNSPSQDLQGLFIQTDLGLQLNDFLVSQLYYANNSLDVDNVKTVQYLDTHEVGLELGFRVGFHKIDVSLLGGGFYRQVKTASLESSQRAASKGFNSALYVQYQVETDIMVSFMYSHQRSEIEEDSKDNPLAAGESIGNRVALGLGLFI